MNKVELAEALDPLIEQKTVDSATENSQNVLRILRSALVRGDEDEIRAIAEAAVEIRENHAARERKHGFPDRRLRSHPARRGY